MNTEALKKAGLELGRVVVLSIIPVIVIGVENGQFDPRVVGVVALIAALRFLDKYLHELGTEGADTRLIKGITRF
jgi:hypothetical protein